MNKHPQKNSLRDSFDELVLEATNYFEAETDVVSKAPSEPEDEKVPFWSGYSFKQDHFWKMLPVDLRTEAADLVDRLLALSGEVAEQVRGAPLTCDADERDVMKGTKMMRSALLFDLASYNCPEYENLRDLRQKLTKRLEYMTNRTPKTP